MLTAHPTEIVRRTLLQKHDRIARALAMQDRADLTVPEREDADRHAAPRDRRRLGDRRNPPQRPTPLDEVRGGLLVFEQTLWDALPRYLRELDRALRAHTGRRLPLDAAPIRFGSWIGGDRDGNPNVTPEVTRQAMPAGALDGGGSLLPRNRRAARRAVDGELQRRAARACSATSHEPYRALLRDVRER